ncbi:MAG: TIGR03067 domain-containing protein [Gemmataceae bacterium]|nr:TIGR03067 domain-containing protein [Gemmataceae bacterium]
MSRARFIPFAAAMVFVAPAGAEDKPAKFDPQKLLGKYIDIEGMKDGEKADPDRLKGQFVTVTKDVFKIEGDLPQQTFEFAYKLDVTKTPVEIDLEIQYPEDLKGNKARGIIAFDGKTLKLCYHKDDKDRPKKFEATAENGYFLWTMKKAEKK